MYRLDKKEALNQLIRNTLIYRSIFTLLQYDFLEMLVMSVVKELLKPFLFNFPSRLNHKW